MKRKVISEIYDHLNRRQITLIIGARQTGKTIMMKQLKSDLDKQRDLNFFLTMENPNHLNLLNYNHLSNDLNITNKTLESYIHLIKKSFHLFTINPFFNNVSKELRKQPKLYFADLGLRNYFCNNFDPIGLREDRGMLFENFIFRRFYDKYSIDEINFWRTQKKQEIDFIIKGKSAWEVKFSENLFNEKKYKYFKSNYPDIPLKLIHFDNAIVIKL